MLDTVAQGINNVLDKFKGRGTLNEENIQEGLREIRMALLEADVSYKVAKEFIKKVTEKAIGQEVIKNIRPGQQIVKIVNDELVELMGGDNQPINYNKKNATIIMMVGLQGAGKTTTTAKLAMKLRKEGRKPIMVAADLQRPAAVEQLKTLGRQLNIEVFTDESTPVRVCRRAVKYANENNFDTILFDTAGRLHIDDELMKELEKIKKKTSPDEILFVCDSMVGQDAVKSAQEFNNRLEFNGVILTKLDSDTRGGAALSIRGVTGKPIKFVGMGEKLDELEAFHPDRMTSRILGMGDVISLVEKAQDAIDEDEALSMAKKMQENKFNLDDFLKQLGMIKKMGSIKDLMGMIPGLGSKIGDMDFDDKEFTKLEAMIQSMTLKERRRPDLIDRSRRHRIAKGSGAEAHDVNKLLKQFKQMRKMMKKMSSMMGSGKGMGLPNMPAGLKGLKGLKW